MNREKIQEENKNLRLNERYEIMTPDGFQPFYGVRKVLKKEWFLVRFSDNTEVQASGKHIVELTGGRFCEVRNLGEGARLKGPGNKVVTSLEFKQEPTWMYDIVDTPDHLYMSDGFISHNCDFLASGDTVFEPEDMTYYEQTYQTDPVEKRGADGNMWIWEYPEYTRSYIISADVARGDGTDFSAFHVIDVETAVQVAEYRGKVSPRDYGNILVGVAAEYNNALLVVENASIGWSTIEQIIARGYGNLHYGSNSTMDTAESYTSKLEHDKLTPGFTMSARTRPLVIAKMCDYILQKATTIRSKRLLMEMRVFVWKNGKAQAQDKYNDDLIMSYATGLYVRDKALRLRQQGIDLSRAQLSSFGNLNKRTGAVVSSTSFMNNPYVIKNAYGQDEDISWVLE